VPAVPTQTRNCRPLFKHARKGPSCRTCPSGLVGRCHKHKAVDASVKGDFKWETAATARTLHRYCAGNICPTCKPTPPFALRYLGAGSALACEELMTMRLERNWLMVCDLDDAPSGASSGDRASVYSQPLSSTITVDRYTLATSKRRQCVAYVNMSRGSCAAAVLLARFGAWSA